MKAWSVAVSLACLFAAYSNAATEERKPGAAVPAIASLDEIEELLSGAVAQYLPVAPPDASRRYIHGGAVFPVDWMGGGFPDLLKKRMVAQLHPLDHAGGVVPVYSLTVLRDYWNGDLVFFDSAGREVFRKPVSGAYDPYAWAVARFGAKDARRLSDFQRSLYHESRIGLELRLVPEPFMEYYERNAAMAAQAVAAERLAEPPAVPLPASVVGVETLADGTVVVELGEPGADAPAPAMMAMGGGSSIFDQDPVDGLSDVWVREMAGGVVDPPDSDLDGDGMTFQAEHDLGLNPNVPDPVFFHIFWNNRVILELNDVQGVDYALDENQDLATSWLTIPLPLPGDASPAPYHIYVPYSAPHSFWRIRGVGYQDSGDDELNDFEEHLLGTSTALAESDGDGLPDAYEFPRHLDPASAAGVDGALGDADGDGFGNLEEYLHGTAQPGDTGTVATIRYYYDEDDRLTDFFCGSEVAQKTILSASHNISEEVSAK